MSNCPVTMYGRIIHHERNFQWKYKVPFWFPRLSVTWLSQKPSRKLQVRLPGVDEAPRADRVEHFQNRRTLRRTLKSRWIEPDTPLLYIACNLIAHDVICCSCRTNVPNSPPSPRARCRSASNSASLCTRPRWP